MPTLPEYLRFSVSTKVTLGLSIGVGILLVLGAFGLYGVGEFFKTGREVRHLLQVRGNLEVLRRDIERTELVQLRYQLTGDPADRNELPELSVRVFSQIEALRGMLAATEQIARLDQLKRAVATRFGALGEAMLERGAGGARKAPLRGGLDAAAGRGVENTVDAIGEYQRTLARESAERVENLIRSLVLLAFWCGTIALGLLVWTISVINRYERDRMHTESDLGKARERLAIALDGSNSAAWDWDLPRDEIYLSAGWARMLGGEAREMAITPAALLGLVHADDLSSVQLAIQSALSGKTPDYREEHRVRSADGRWIWILSRGTVVQRDGSGRALRITGINQEVTERKAIELALKEHDLQLQLALAAAGMVRWEWDVIADEFVWPEDPARVVGAAPRNGYMGLRDMVHPEDLVHFIRTLDQATRDGETYRDEYRVLRTDGTIVWVSARGYVVRGVGGSAARVIGVAQDVSEIKHAEQAMRASERELRLITDSVPAFISYADAHEVVRFCNKALATFVGTQPQDMIGRKLRDLYGEEVYRILQPYVQRALAGERVQFQRRQTGQDGVAVDLDVTYIPRRGALGEADGFYALLTDITELKRLDRMKSEFVSTVSHELRTPLTSIRGSLGILAGGVAGPLSDKVRGFIDIAKDNCERLIRLINDILDIEKIESGKMTFQLRELDLMQLIEQTVKANEGFAAQHKVRLHIVSARPGVKVKADGDRLTQVLTNLISNACKFSPAQSSVDIRVSGHDERCFVEIIDHGPGISDVFRNRIFQKFSQEDSSDMRQKGGTGLGLSISKAIIEGLGGEIGFETEVGKGSTFYFYLPQWSEPGAQQAVARLERTRLLVCEMDAEVGRRLQAIADKAGFDSDLAGSTAELRLLLRQRRYVAMTLDLDRYGQDAAALMLELRSNPETADLPVIALCAEWEQGKQKIGNGVIGVVDWLSKPVDEARLVTAVRSVQRAGGARPRILHVEDNADVRHVVATIARDVAEFVAAGTVAEARVRLAREKFDLVLLDLGLPDGSGWDLLPIINGLKPSVRVVVFSAQDVVHGSENPPCAFLVKSQTSDERLIEVIREAVRAAE
ncbi:MAG: PAS domain S-box protein [Betaproteobacteria bacterium]|nr:MAG: PAS domain S-box protein [Betaproteobacteria bacterium]